MIQTTGLDCFSARLCAIIEMGFACSDGHSGVVHSAVPLTMILAGNWPAMCAQTSSDPCLRIDTGAPISVPMRDGTVTDAFSQRTQDPHDFVLAASAFGQASGSANFL